MAQYCINHPTKIGRHKCRYCGSYICRECKLEKPNGVFCSEKCAEEFSRVNKTVAQNDELKQKRSSMGVPAPAKYLFYLIMLFVIVYFGLKFATGIDLIGKLLGD